VYTGHTKALAGGVDTFSEKAENGVIMGCKIQPDILGEIRTSCPWNWLFTRGPHSHTISVCRFSFLHHVFSRLPAVGSWWEVPSDVTLIPNNLPPDVTVRLLIFRHLTNFDQAQICAIN
jgi:hypothetical protein